MIVAMAVTAAVFVASWLIWRRAGTVNDASPVIAVLPLVAPDQSSAYLGDGISESVINSLTRLRGIKVLARTTTFRYRGEHVDHASLRRELGVDAILTGTVSQRGDDLVVQAELINAADNTHLWGQRYNRKVNNVFEVQEEIARAIASRLGVELTGREAGFTKRYTDDVEAYRAYVLGRETRSDTRSAISRTRWITSGTPSAEIRDTRWPGPGSPRRMSICGRAGRCTTAKGGGWHRMPLNVPVISILISPRLTPPSAKSMCSSVLSTSRPATARWAGPSS